MWSLDDRLFQYLNAHQSVGNKKPPVYGQGGLSPAKVDLIEECLGIGLPSDFKQLLMNVIDPDEVLFPWANFSLDQYNQRIEWIWSGIEFDIEMNGVWLSRWGVQPASLSKSKSTARKDFETWPKLLPIYGHRFLAAEPCKPGNPVFSIMQTDIIYYGSNLADYLVHEFCGWNEEHHAPTPRAIDVWSDFAEWY